MKSATLLCLLSVAWATLSAAQIQLVQVEQGNSSVPAACISVLNQNVTCDASLNSVAGGHGYGALDYFPDSTKLAALCNTACSTSLSTWQRRIAGACGTGYWDAADGSQYLPAALAERYIEVWNSACLKNTAGQYCNAVLGSALCINPVNQQSTATPGTYYGASTATFGTPLCIPFDFFLLRNCPLPGVRSHLLTLNKTKRRRLCATVASSPYSEHS